MIATTDRTFDGEFIVGEDEIRVSARRCFGGAEGDDDVIELVVEKLNGSWFLSCVCLTPQQAIDIGSTLLREAVKKGPKHDA